MRTRLRRGSTLSDITQAGSFSGTPPSVTPGTGSGIGGVDIPGLGSGAIGDLARSVIQIPFDDSIDTGGTLFLECFFQMPTGVVRIKSAQVWVQQKSFRQYVKAISGTTSGNGGGGTSASGGGGTSSSGGSTSVTSQAGVSHNHSEGTVFVTGNSTSNDSPTSGNQTVLHTHVTSGVTSGTESSNHPHIVTHSHTFSYNSPQSFTGPENGHTHGVTIGAHSHTTDIHTHTTDVHTHTITPALTTGIFETAAAGTMSLFVADDGTTYGAAITTGVSIMTAQTITPGLTITPGNKRIKIVSTGLCRVQVLLVLDLILQLGAA